MASGSNSTPCRRTCSSQFVERKLNENGVAKVIPSAETLAETFTTFKRGRLAQAALKAELERLNAEPVDVPADLEAGEGPSGGKPGRDMGQRRQGDHR